MKILNFLKRLFSDKNSEKKEGKKVKIKEAKEFIEEKETFLRKKEIEIIKEIGENISILVRNLKEGLEELKKINIDDRKVEEKIKFLTREGLRGYSLNLEKLIETLSEVKEKIEKQIETYSLENIFTKIDSILEEFDKKSAKNFHNATFLIGKELDKIRNALGDFSFFLKKLLEKNRKIIEEHRLLLGLKGYIKDLEVKKKELSELKKEIKSLNSLKKNLSKEIDGIKKLIEIKEKSEEYEEEVRESKKLERVNQEFKNKLLNLKSKIDFKLLMNLFHSDEKKRNLIKNYRDSFMNTFEKDKGKGILDILPQPHHQNFEEALKKILEEKNKIKEMEIEISKEIKIKKELENLKKKIEEKEDEKSEIEKSIQKISKKHEKQKEILKNFILKIAKEFEKLGIKIEK